MDGAQPQCTNCKALDGTHVARSRVSCTGIVVTHRGAEGTAFRGPAEHIMVGSDGLCSHCRQDANARRAPVVAHG